MADGATASFESIEEKSVVSVYKSLSGKRIKAEIKSAVVTETITSVLTEENGLIKLISDGGEYVYYVKNAAHNLSVGDEAELYLDAKGFVAWANTTKKEQFFGYIIKTGIDNDFDRVWIKLLNENGKIERYTTGKKVRVDGVILRDSDALMNMLGANKQIAVFKVNSDDEITYIDTLYNGTDEKRENSLMAVDSFASRRYRSFGRLGETILLNNNTKIFAISESTSGMSEDDCFSVKRKNDLMNETFYTARSVRIGTEDKSYADVVIIKDADWSPIANATPMIVVTSLKTLLNDDDEIVNSITGLTKGGEVSYITESYYSASDDGISVGDVIRVKLNNDGNVVGREMVYDFESKRTISKDVYSAFRGVRAYAHKKIDNTLMVGYNNGADFNEIFDLTSKPIIVFDSESPRGDETRIGTMGDIITYEMAGGACSEMVIQTNYGEPVMVIVYK